MSALFALFFDYLSLFFAFGQLFFIIFADLILDYFLALAIFCIVMHCNLIDFGLSAILSGLWLCTRWYHPLTLDQNLLRNLNLSNQYFHHYGIIH